MSSRRLLQIPHSHPAPGAVRPSFSARLARRATLAAVCSLVFFLVRVAPGQPAQAADEYEAILEWNGPIFRAINRPGLDQLTDVPATATAFSSPRGLASRTHVGRKTVYVLDSGNERIQMFEVNATYQYVKSATFTYQAGGVSGASEWDGDEIQLPEWALTPTNWIIPRSELILIDGVTWSWVSDLTGFTSDDEVYTTDYDVASGGPEIVFPAGSLSETTSFRARYLITDNQTGAADAFGIGDLDYGSGFDTSPVLVTIDGSSGGPVSFESLAGLFVISNETTATSDDLFIVDAGDDSDGQDEELFYFTVAQDGGVSYAEAYDDSLETPEAVAVGRITSSTVASAALSNDAGPFDLSGVQVIDDSQVTGHTYSVEVAPVDNVTITDTNTGKVLLDAADFFSIQNPFLGIPGLSLDKNLLPGVSNTLTTVRAEPQRFVFVADTGSDRIKVLSAADGAGFNGDWLPGDQRTVVSQPGSSIGDDATEDFSEQTPATVPNGYTTWTTAFPIAEGALDTLNINGTWTRVEDLSAAGPTDQVYELDWKTGLVLFGDGINGQVPDAGQEIVYTYKTSPDIVRYGFTGTGSGEFQSPSGIAARWNASGGYFDVYVADTGNHRIQKLAFHPEDVDLHLPASIEYITSWNTVSGAGDTLSAPTGLAVVQDGASPSNIWLAVTDVGNDRIVLYRDIAAQVGGSSPPTFETEVGATGISLGGFQLPSAVTMLADGTEIEIYAADQSRGVATKFEKQPTPGIAVNWALASCYPPYTSYEVSFSTEEPPNNGWVDLYFDTIPTFDEGSAQLAIPAGTVNPDSGSLVWSFPDTPGGAPDDDTYYLFAKLRDAEGEAVAADSTSSNETVCLDSSITHTSSATDGLDGDRTLYLQHGGTAALDLTIQYADSVIGAVFAGSFDPDLLEVRSIVAGTPWEGTGFTDVLFTSAFDNTAGTIEVSSSALGTPIGLVGAGPYTIATVNVAAKDGVIDTVTRYRDSSLQLDSGGSRVITVSGTDGVIVQDIDIRFAYLGDIATTLTGAEGTVPQLAPRPDGLIGFEDVIAFTLGWKGQDLRQDPIADIGPTIGNVPNLRSNPDGLWDIEDLLAFTAMYSWAAANGFNQGARLPNSESDPGAIEQANASSSSNAGGTSDWVIDWNRTEPGAQVWFSSALEDATVGEQRDLEIWAGHVPDLHGAHLVWSFDPAWIEVLSAAPGDLLLGSDGAFFHDTAENATFEAVIARLDRTPDRETRNDSGVICNLTVRVIGAKPESEIAPLRFDLRDSKNVILGRNLGDPPSGGDPNHPNGAIWLHPAAPNPAAQITELGFGLRVAAPVRLDVFDAAGRRIRALVDKVSDAGEHRLSFDLRDDRGRPLRAGVYFYRLSSPAEALTNKLVVVR